MVCFRHKVTNTQSNTIYTTAPFEHRKERLKDLTVGAKSPRANLGKDRTARTWSIAGTHLADPSRFLLLLVVVRPGAPFVASLDILQADLRIQHDQTKAFDALLVAA